MAAPEEPASGETPASDADGAPEREPGAEAEAEAGAGAEATVHRGAKAYDFVHPDHRLAGDWPVLGSIHQQFVDELARRLGERFRIPLEGRTDTVRRSRYVDFAADVPGGTVVHEILLGSAPGVALLCLDAGLVPALVDGWFGGTPRVREGDPDVEPALSSATERRALAHLLEAIGGALGESLAGIDGPKPGTTRRTPTRHLARGGYGDVVVECPFTLAPGADALPCRLVYPLSVLEPHAERLARENHSHPVHESGFREALGGGLLDCELEIRGVLAETRVTLAELMALAPGDFIPLRDIENVSFLTRNTPLFDARVGKTNGRVSASLSRWHLPTGP